MTAPPGVGVGDLPEVCQSVAMAAELGIRVNLDAARTALLSREIVDLAAEVRRLRGVLATVEPSERDLLVAETAYALHPDATSGSTHREPMRAALRAAFAARLADRADPTATEEHAQ